MFHAQKFNLAARGPAQIAREVPALCGRQGYLRLNFLCYFLLFKQKKVRIKLMKND
jgi:hypothetical protein